MTPPDTTGPGARAAGPGAPDPHLATVEELIRHRLASALGGWHGAVEMALPTAGFVIVWLWRADLKAALIVAGALAVILAALRLVRRGTLQHVAGSLVAVGLAAWFALRSGRAEDAFLPGMYLSAAYGVGTLLSIATRWPAIGFLVGAADPRAAEDPFRWRKDRAIVAVCSRLTWVLVGLYAVRLAIMVPLYLAQEIAALGVAKIVLGWPLWIAGLAIMGGLLARGHTPLSAEDEPTSD